MKLSTSLLLFAACFFLQKHANAQCNVFNNADSANPVLSALPKGETIVSLDFVDIDGDGDADCYVIPDRGAPVLYRNTGKPKLPKYEMSTLSGFETATTPLGSPVIQFVDIDGDGDFDCFISEVSYDFRPITSIRFYKNTGTSKEPKFEEVDDNNPVSFARSSGNYVLFTFADIDNDGDMDFYYTGLYNATLTDYDQFTYLNTGTAQAPSFTLYSNDHPHDFQRQRTYYDWNHDGLPDYIKFNDVLNSYNYLQNEGPVQRPVFGMAPDNAPQFTNGTPFRIVDLNDDGAPESFSANGHYSTVAPVAVISHRPGKFAHRTAEYLYSSNQSPAYKYHWAYNGNLIKGYNKPFIYSLLPGSYVLFVTNDCGTGYSLAYETGSDNMLTNMAGATDKSALSPAAQNTATVKTYPNPFVNGITVQLPATFDASRTTIKITDVAGRAMLTQTASSSLIKLGETLPKGSYILEIRNEEKTIYHTKILKQ